MLSRKVKAAYFQCAGPVMRVNGWIYRRLRAPRGGFVRVQLGSGMKYLDGWVNVDANTFTARCDVWADLRAPLPFADNSVDCFYSHHMIEHLPNLKAHVEDVYRCLKPGGVYRVAGPSGDSAIKKFMEGDSAWFDSWPDNRASIGGRFENFIFCRGEHLTILTKSYLEELLGGCGFVEMSSHIATKTTAHPKLFEQCLPLEHEKNFETPYTVVIEGTKPGKRA